jgi:hypothetical protein
VRPGACCESNGARYGTGVAIRRVVQIATHDVNAFAWDHPLRIVAFSDGAVRVFDDQALRAVAAGRLGAELAHR